MRLFDINADLAQTKDLSAQYPEVVERLKAAYEEIWASMEPGFEAPRYIVVGTERENPAVLTAHDWVEGGVPYDQWQIVKGINTNGYWTVKFAKSGKYRFSLRRWPPEIGRSIHFLKEDRIFNRAILQIGDQKHERKIYPEERGIVFELKVEKGNHDVKTFLCEGENKVRGAYYLVVEHLGR